MPSKLFSSFIASRTSGIPLFQKHTRKEYAMFERRFYRPRFSPAAFIYRTRYTTRSGSKRQTFVLVLQKLANLDESSEVDSDGH